MERFDAIGGLYEQVKHLPICVAERGTLLSVLPNLAGKSVLDVASGTGFYSRLFKQLGAVRVIGVDISREMIAYARRVEEQEPLGISFDVHDAVTLPKLGEFDVVIAMWLLNYAPGVAALERVLANLVANLAEAGTLVALVPNPEYNWDGLDMFRRYGYSVVKGEMSEGRQGYTVHFDTEPPIDFGSFIWPAGVLEPAFLRAGLTDIRRHPVTIPGEALVERGRAYWADLVANPPFEIFTAINRRPCTGFSLRRLAIM